MKEITEEDIGKVFDASEIEIFFLSPEHKTVTILDVWVKGDYKYIQWVCTENKRIVKVTKRKYKKPNEGYRRTLPPSFP